MACKSILSLVATEKLQKDKSLNIERFDDIDKGSLSHKRTGLFEQVQINERGNIPNAEILDIGNKWRNDLYGLNLVEPKEFTLIDISTNDTSVIDPKTISEVAPKAYEELIKCNFYAHKKYEMINLELCRPQPVQVDNYIDYIKDKVPKLYNNLLTIFKLNGDDTLLGKIGRESLINSLKTNILYNTVTEIGNYVETSLLNIVEQKKIFKQPYDITKPKKFGGIYTELENILGFTVPISYIPDNAFDFDRQFFNYKSGELEADTTDSRRDIILDYTGAGQKKHILYLMSMLKYKPNILTQTGNFYVPLNILNTPYVINSNKLNTGFTNNNINEITYNTSGINIKYKNQNVSDIFSNPAIFTETSNNLNVYTVSSIVKYDIDGLLGKTDRMIYDKYFDETSAESKRLQSKIGYAFIDPRATEFKEIINGKEHIISKGDMVTAREDIEVKGDEGITDYIIKKNDFLRVWTKNIQHDRLNRTIAHRGLDLKTTKSVLGDNGLVNFAPTFRNRNNTNIKNYMLSIENLAWSDNIGDLPFCEIGNGDYQSQKKGRVMWFPPYDLHFSESIATNWTEHNFIGRGEALYTYNNTKRSGTLNFTMIMDYPALLNKIKGQRTEFWERYFKGDTLTYKEAQEFINNNLTNDEKKIIDNLKNRQQKPKKVDTKVVSSKQDQVDKIEKSQKKISNSVPVLSVYFPNEVGEIPDVPLEQGGRIERNAGYQTSYQRNLKYTFKNGVRQTNNKIYNNAISYNLNDFFYNNGKDAIINTVSNFIEQGYDIITLIVYGLTSQASPLKITNERLGNQRAASLLNFTKKVINDNNFKNIEFKYESHNLVDSNLSFSQGTGEDSDRNSLASVNARQARVHIVGEKKAETLPTVVQNVPKDIIPITDNNITETPVPNENVLQLIDINLLEKLLYTDCNQFEYLETYDKAIFNTISERIKYFTPAYHSMTPQGFHTRLTFLQQCTRQGNSFGLDGVNNIQNLAFGNPPVCILKVGDFYHTKIIINSMTIDYNDKITWDLNPEGVGVTPMIAKITLSFDYIGGQSLSAPINKLQNALSYNFYANTELYDSRSDKFINTDSEFKLVDGLKISDYTTTQEFNELSNNKSKFLNLEHLDTIKKEETTRFEDRLPNTNQIQNDIDGDARSFLNLRNPI